MIRWPPEQPDLFGPVEKVNEAEEERFGFWDARTSGRNHYSSQISGKRLEAYERGYRRGLQTLRDEG